jgi:hypothetical protein
MSDIDNEKKNKENIENTKNDEQTLRSHQNSHPFIIANIIKKIEEDYLDKLKLELGEKFINSKIERMNKLLLEIDGKNVISLRDYENICKLAKEKGGFINNSYRREFYKKAFKLEDNYINFIVKDGDAFKNQNHHIDEFSLNKFQDNYCFEKNTYYQ